MKKTSKLFGAVALSAALALGTAVPAFAIEKPTTPPSVTETTDAVDGTQDGKAKSQVDINTYISQISVAVPLTLPIALDMNGGQGVAPTGYYIENLSGSNIEVTEIKWAIPTTKQSKFNLTDQASAEISANTPPTVSKGTSTTAPSLGTVALTMKGATGNEPGTKASEVAVVGSSADTFNGKKENPEWTIAPATNNTPGDGSKLNLDVKCYSSTIANMISTTEENVIQLTYKVGAISK